MEASNVGVVEQWNRVKSNIKDEIGEDKYTTWFQTRKIGKVG